MRTLPLLASGAVALASLTAVGATTSAVHAAPAYTAYALSGSSLLSFDIADPAHPTSKTVTGVAAGESLVGLDVRPQNGQLYALGVNAAADKATLYLVHEQTGVATPVGTAGGIAFTTNGATTVDLPDPATVGYGVDVNPAADRIRVVAGALNFRVNPVTGAGVDGNNGTASAVTGTNPDGSTNGGTTGVDGAAYTNDRPNVGVTTLYTLDSTTNALFIQTPPNSGTQTQQLAVTLGGSPLDFTTVGGFDIPTGVDAASSNTAVTSGSGYAAMTVGGATRLYTVNLVDGAAALVGTIGDGTLPVQGLALQSDVADGYPAIGLSADGASLVRFSTTSPGTTTTVPLSGLAAGERGAAVAWRPLTGQLIGLGINPATDTGSLYAVDPQSGAASAIGSTGQLAWVDAGGHGVELPDPTSTAYAMDVNPQVDRVRIVAGGGLNARVNPSTGAAVDGDSMTAGTQPDGATGAALTGISYTNAYGGAAVTTLHALAWSLDQAVTVDPANNGTLTDPHTVTSGGAQLDFGPFGGLDIPEDVPGTAYAALTVGGQSGLYRIDLATGAATRIGDLTALRSLTLGQAGASRPVSPPPVDPPVDPPVVHPPAVKPATLKRVAAAKQVHRMVDTGRVLGCPTAFKAAACTTKVRVVATYKVKVHGKKKTRRVVIGTVTVRTAKARTTRLRVTLSKKGVKLLKQRTTLAARVAILGQTGPKGAVRTTTVAVTLRKKRL